MAITFAFLAASPHSVSFTLNAAVPVGSGTLTNANLVAFAIPGPLADFLARTDLTDATIHENCDFTFHPGGGATTTVGRWGAAPAPDGNNQLEIPLTADTDATSATIMITLVHSAVR